MDVYILILLVKVVKLVLQLLDKEFQYNDFEVTSFPIKSPNLCRG